jgi:ankyrin repeat protein
MVDLFGQVDALYLLMDNGADIDYETKDAKTALIHAGECERVAAIRALVERGALPDRESLDGRTPLIAAIAADKLQVRTRGAVHTPSDVQQVLFCWSSYNWSSN